MATADQIGVADVLEVVLQTFQIQGDLHGDELKMLCPVHTEANPSADVNVVTGLWSCFSCGTKGDLIDLGVAVLHQVPPEAEWVERKPLRDIVSELLSPQSPDAKIASIHRKVANIRRVNVSHEKIERPDKRNMHPPSRYHTGPYQYMYDRGFTRETMKKWRVRYTQSARLIRQEQGEDKSFSVEHSIAIPIRNQDQRLEAWCYRATERSANWQPKYLYTPKFDLSSNWFGLHLHHEEKEIFIVEGPLDAMWLDQMGYPALAMMGSNHKNPRKFRLLERYEKVTILPDYDVAGVSMTHRLGSILRGRIPTFVCRWPRAVVRRTGEESPDPQDIRNARDLKLVVSRAVPWQAWNLRQSL